METATMTVGCAKERRRNWYAAPRKAALSYERHNATDRSYARLLAARRQKQCERAILSAVEAELVSTLNVTTHATALDPIGQEKANLCLPIQFQANVERWERDTRFTSSLSEVTQHPSYRAIIRMGPEVVPFILRDLQKSGRFWFSALVEITGENPIKVEEAGHIKKMTKAWIEWGKENGYL